MAELRARIKPKKSSTTGEAPQAADLEVAEIAVNTADGKLFTKHADNSIVEVGATSIDDLTDVDTASTPPTSDQVLRWNGSNWVPAAARTVLGIGEYVDDAAAGTGGVASGALYYNTTSSDYRLKT